VGVDVEGIREVGVDQPGFDRVVLEEQRLPAHLDGDRHTSSWSLLD